MIVIDSIDGKQIRELTAEEKLGIKESPITNIFFDGSKFIYFQGDETQDFLDKKNLQQENIIEPDYLDLNNLRTDQLVKLKTELDKLQPQTTEAK